MTDAPCSTLCRSSPASAVGRSLTFRSVTLRSAESVLTPSLTCTVTTYAPSELESSGASKSLEDAKARLPPGDRVKWALSDPPEMDQASSAAGVSPSVAVRVATAVSPSATV